MNFIFFLNRTTYSSAPPTEYPKYLPMMSIFSKSKFKIFDSIFQVFFELFEVIYSLFKPYILIVQCNI